MSAATASAATPAGEFKMSDSDFARIVAIMERESGIQLDQSKRSLVYARLTKRLRKYGFKSFNQYCDFLAAPEGATEKVGFISALTTHVTRFFREPHHFEFMKQTVLPPLLEAARKGTPVRMWSAGCSSGEEPYTMALTLLACDPRAKGMNIKILATDIDPITLDVGRRGQYKLSDLGGVPADLRERYFRKVSTDYGEASDELKSLITFRQLNLNQERDWPVRGPFDIVFCRNTVIYFGAEVQDRFWRRLTPRIGTGGWLFLGHSERLSELIHPSYEAVGITTYKRLGAPGANR